MGKILVIAEKKAQGQAYASALGATVKKDGYMEGNNYIVTWCQGHLVGLSEPHEYDKKYDVPPWETNLTDLPIIPATWKFTVDKDKRKQFETVKKLLNSPEVTEIIIGTDAGREGECIFRYVYHAANCKNRNVKRLWLASLEEKAIREGFKNLRLWSEFDNLYDAGLCRAKADWLIGMSGTRLMSAVYKTFLSVGRVQTPTLAMIAERDNKVKNFVKEKYFNVKINCGGFTASSERINDLPKAEQIQAACTGKTAAVTSVKREQKTVKLPKLYDLCTLQREANRIYGYTAQQTLDTLQGLYLRKITTYPRVDSQYITDDMADSTAYLVERFFNKFNKKGDSYKNTCNISQVVNSNLVHDHHAILPTLEAVKSDLSGLSEEENNILFLIITKLLCAVENPYVYETITVKIVCGSNEFTAKGRRDISLGWKQMDVVAKAISGFAEKADEVETFLSVDEEQTFQNPVCNIVEGWTSPPKHYTEDTLLSAMETAGNADYDSDSDVEKKGIGTPATRAGTIETLVKRGYIVRDKKNILATEKGSNLVKIVPNNIKSPKLTAEWETELQKIERGESGADDFMSGITAFTKTLVAINSTAAQEHINSFSSSSGANIIGKCVKCGGDVIENSKAYSCGKRCGFVIWKTIASKSISAAQAIKLLEKGKSDKIKGFKGGKGDFEAFLIVKKDFTIGFEFEQRKDTKT